MKIYINDTEIKECNADSVYKKHMLFDDIPLPAVAAASGGPQVIIMEREGAKERSRQNALDLLRKPLPSSVCNTATKMICAQ